MKYIDAEKLVAELTKMQFTLNAACRKPQSDNIVRAISFEYDDIISLIDSLQEETPTDLEEAAEEFAEGEWDGEVVDADGNPLYAQDEIEYAFKAGAEWQAKQLIQGAPMPEDTVLFNKGVAEGRRLEREDMMKEGVMCDAGVCKLADRVWVTPINEKKFHQDVYDHFVAGQKVQIIIMEQK